MFKSLQCSIKWYILSSTQSPFIRATVHPHLRHDDKHEATTTFTTTSCYRHPFPSRRLSITRTGRTGLKSHPMTMKWSSWNLKWFLTSALRCERSFDARTTFAPNVKYFKDVTRFLFMVRTWACSRSIYYWEWVIRESPSFAAMEPKAFRTTSSSSSVKKAWLIKYQISYKHFDRAC